MESEECFILTRGDYEWEQSGKIATDVPGLQIDDRPGTQGGTAGPVCGRCEQSRKDYLLGIAGAEGRAGCSAITCSAHAVKSFHL